MTTETETNPEELDTTGRLACAWLMAQHRRHPELAVALAGVPWLADAVATWLVHDDRDAHNFGCRSISGEQAERAVAEFMRLTSLG